MLYAAPPRRWRILRILLLASLPLSIASARTSPRPDVLPAVRVQRTLADRVRAEEIAVAQHRYRIDRHLAEVIHDAATAEGVPPRLAYALVEAESGFDEHAVSPAGALGLTQLMPATARSLDPELTHERIIERHTNLRLGFRYLSGLTERFDGDVRLALLAYNRGPGTVRRLLADGLDPTNGYVARVLTGTSRPHPRLPAEE